MYKHLQFVGISGVSTRPEGKWQVYNIMYSFIICYPTYGQNRMEFLAAQWAIDTVKVGGFIVLRGRRVQVDGVNLKLAWAGELETDDQDNASHDSDCCFNY